jgi:uncharacterized membrane protein
MMHRRRNAAMLPSFLTKPSPKLLNGIIIGLALLLVGMGGLGFIGIKLPATVASTVSDVAFVTAILVYLYSRRLRTEAAKADKAKEAEAITAANPEGQADPASSEGRSNSSSS